MYVKSPSMNDHDNSVQQQVGPIKEWAELGFRVDTLPDETLVYPAHDYEQRFITTIAQEKQRNPRLGKNKPLKEFVTIMDTMDLPYPRKIDFSVPGSVVSALITSLKSIVLHATRVTKVK